MSRRLLVALLLAVGFPTFASAQSDHDRIQGTWAVVAVANKGYGMPADRARCMLVKIDDKRIRILEANRHFAEVVLYELDPSKNPKWIDLICARESYGEPRILGIYSLDGDVLKMAWRRSAGPRPTDFVCRRQVDPVVTYTPATIPLHPRPEDLVCPARKYWQSEIERAKARGEDVSKYKYKELCCVEDDVMIFLLKKVRNP
jgi:uncharacterized protein (TIGR03067 family)